MRLVWPGSERNPRSGNSRRALAAGDAAGTATHSNHRDQTRVHRRWFARSGRPLSPISSAVSMTSRLGSGSTATGSRSAVPPSSSRPDPERWRHGRERATTRSAGATARRSRLSGRFGMSIPPLVEVRGAGGSRAQSRNDRMRAWLASLSQGLGEQRAIPRVAIGRWLAPPNVDQFGQGAAPYRRQRVLWP